MNADRHDPTERLLGAAFDELRDGDRAATPPPSFASIVARSDASIGARSASQDHRLPAPRVGALPSLRLSVRWLRAGLAATLVLAVASGLAWYRIHSTRSPRFTVPREAAALVAWRPMTDVLLDATEPALLRDRPVLGTSLITLTSPPRTIQ